MKHFYKIFFTIIVLPTGLISYGQKNFEQKLGEANELINNGLSIHNRDTIAEGYFRRGKLADRLGNYKEASEWFQKARLIYLEKGSSIELSRILRRLSILEYQQKHLNESLRLINEAIKVAEECKDDKEKYMAYGFRGRLITEIALPAGDTLNSLKEVTRDFLLAEHFVKRINDTLSLVDFYLLYGGIFRTFKENEKGLNLYYKVNALLANKPFDNTKLTLYINLAFIHLSNHNPELSQQLLRQVESIIKGPEYNNFNEIIRFEEASAMYYEAVGNYEKANKHYRKWKKAVEKATSQDHEGEISKLNRQYDLKAKDIEIEQKKIALATEKKLRNTQKWLLIILVISLAILTALIYYLYKLYSNYKHVSTRNAMLVHEQNHRVKNNLQAISSMLNIQANMSGNKGITESINEIKLRINSMIQLQKQLYGNDIDGLVNLRTLTNELVQSAAFNFNITDLTYEADFDSDEFDMDISMTLALIINELITNACKYAFQNRENPYLSISFKKSEKTMTIEVRDNGIHPITEPKVIAENNSFGFKMINILLLQLDGSLEYQYDVGSVFKIYLN